MPILVKIGVAELTLGVLSGWVMVFISDPDRAQRAGIVDRRRIRQGHLDLLMMGTILVALGAAVPDPPLIAAALIVFGSWLAPLLFFPLSVRPKLGEQPLFRSADRLGFVGLSVGYLWLLTDVLTR